MFVIVTYDVPAKRTEKYRKTLSKFLLGVQFSVFMGDLTVVQYRKLQQSLKQIRHEEDHVLFVSTENRRNIRLVKWSDGIEQEEKNHFGSGVF